MRWLGALALPIALAALLLSLTRPTPSEPASAPLTVAPRSAPDDTTALRSRVAELQAQTALLRAQVEALTTRAAAAPASTVAPTNPGANANAPATDAPVRQLSVQTPGLEVEERGGGLWVTNRDPALTGQVLTLDAQTDDGETKTITITVPPPE